MAQEHQLELPLFTVRESDRAARVTFHLAPGSGLELVVPSRFDQGRLPAVVEQHRQWIDRTTRQLRQRSKGATAARKLELPRVINFRALRERWQIEYTHNPSVEPRLKHDGERSVALRCDLTQTARPLDMLRRWTKRQAERGVVARAHELSRQFNLPVASIEIRNQKTVWGTCTADKRLHFNFRLLFLAPELLDYVIIHELCHTQYMEHSARFWDLVRALCPTMEEAESALKLAWRDIPAWLERG